MCNLNETNDMTRLHRGRISKSQSNIQLLRELSTKKRSQSFFSASTFPWEQKLWNHKILGKCWNQHPEDKNMHNSVQLPHPSEESVYMVSSCFQRSRERVLWTWNKKFHTACKFLACVLPSCTQWRQADDRWWPNGLLAGCILIQLTHVTSTLFRDIQIHSVKQTSHPPKGAFPSKEVVFHYHQFLGAMLFVSGRLPIIILEEALALAESWENFIRLLAETWSVVSPESPGFDSIKPWTNLHHDCWKVKLCFLTDLWYTEMLRILPIVLCDKRLEGAWEASSR